MSWHVVRYGLLGHLGRFAATDAVRYPRGTRVVIRSARGLEVGQIVAEPEPRAAWGDSRPDGPILRRMSVEDELLQARLESRRQEAYVACVELLAQRRIAAPLVDVEHLLDGERLYFYFLGEPPAEATDVTIQLAAAYESAVEFQRFVDTLEHGCGPGCGTAEASGHGGCASCSGCGVAAACGVREH